MNPKKRLGEMLLEAGIIDETQLKAALGHQRQWGVRIGQALVDLKLATEADIVAALAVKFGFDVARLEGLEPYALEQALKLLPREFAVRNNVLPMAADTASVTVAMSDPTNLAIVDEIRFRTGRKVKVCIGGDREIADNVNRCYPGDAGAVEAIALDLDADDSGAEALHDPFGGGSRDALEAFFSSSSENAGTAPAPATAPAPSAAFSTAAPAGRGPVTQSGVRAIPRAPGPLAAPAPAAPPQAAHPPPPPASRVAPASAVPRAQPPAAAAQRTMRPPSAAPAPAAPAQAPLRRPGAAGPAVPHAPRDHGPAGAPGAHETRAQLLGTVPAGGLAPGLEEEPVPSGAPPAEPILATELAPAPDGQPGLLPGARALTQRELSILDALDRLAGGAHAEPEIVKPTQAMAAIIRLLLRKRIVTEQEFLDELSKK